MPLLRTICVGLMVFCFTVLLVAQADAQTFEGKMKVTEQCEFANQTFKLKGTFTSELLGDEATIFGELSDGTVVSAVLKLSVAINEKKGETRVYQDAFIDSRDLLATVILVVTIRDGKTVKGTLSATNYFFDDCAEQLKFKGKRI